MPMPSIIRIGLPIGGKIRALLTMELTTQNVSLMLLKKFTGNIKIIISKRTEKQIPDGKH
jgi:hypothetical protein